MSFLTSHHEQLAESVLKDCDMFFADHSPYVIVRNAGNANLLPNDFADALAWTGVNLTACCEPWLRKTGRWHGYGPTMIINRAESLEHFLGSVCHEGGHQLAWQITVSEPAGHHGPVFLRSTFMLHQRMGCAFGRRRMPPSNIFAALSRSHGKAAIWQYRDALASELAEDILLCERAGNWAPIVGLLRRQPPLEFQDLCNFDARQNGWTHPYPLAAYQSPIQMATPPAPTLAAAPVQPYPVADLPQGRAAPAPVLPSVPAPVTVPAAVFTTPAPQSRNVENYDALISRRRAQVRAGYSPGLLW